MWTLLQTTPTNDLFSLLQFGVLGIVLLALILGYLWTKPAVGALMDELKVAREHGRVLEAIRAELQQIRSELQQFRHQQQRLIDQEEARKRER